MSGEPGKDGQNVSFMQAESLITWKLNSFKICSLG